MGWPDRRDMLQWIDWIIRRDSEAKIVLHGISMGGATVMMTAGEDLPGQVKAVVEDCGYTSVWDIFTDELDYLFHLPAFPLLNIASCLSSLRAGYSFSEASSTAPVFLESWAARASAFSAASLYLEESFQRILLYPSGDKIE